MFITLRTNEFYKKIKQDNNFKNQLEKIYGNVIFDKYFIREGSLFIYYQKDNTIVASMRINKKKDMPVYDKFFHIRGVFVNPDFRGQGFCKKIIGHVIEILENEKLPIILDVLPDNLPAISCYKSNDFVEIGKRDINNVEHITMIHKK